MITKLIGINAACTGDPGSPISSSSPADKFALWAPKPQTAPFPRLLPAPRPRKGDACRGKEGNQVYFVRRAFCAKVTLGFRAKRMKHELSFSKWIWVHTTLKQPFTHSIVFSPTWIPDRSTWKKQFWAVDFSTQILIATWKQKLPHSCLHRDHRDCRHICFQLSTMAFCQSPGKESVNHQICPDDYQICPDICPDSRK